jgi:hypothetical protein
MIWTKVKSCDKKARSCGNTDAADRQRANGSRVMPVPDGLRYLEVFDREPA